MVNVIVPLFFACSELLMQHGLSKPCRPYGQPSYPSLTCGHVFRETGKLKTLISPISILASIFHAIHKSLPPFLLYCILLRSGGSVTGGNQLVLL